MQNDTDVTSRFMQLEKIRCVLLWEDKQVNLEKGNYAVRYDAFIFIYF